MFLWLTRFQTVRPMESCPRLQLVAAERQDSPRYRHEGRFRMAEQHCLFKFTLRGEGIFRDRRGEHRVPAGRGFLCEIRDPATAYYYPPDGRTPWEFVYLCFAGAWATPMAREFLSRHGPVFELPSDRGFVAELLAWERHKGREVPIAPAEGAHVVAGLFDALSRSCASAGVPDSGQALVGRAMQLIRDGTHRALNVKTMAAELGVSREHLTRVFREQTAQTPYQYLLRQKMLEACRLLKETSASGKEIAEKLGYDTPAHFTRTFTRVMRMTPSRFKAVGTIPVR